MAPVPRSRLLLVDDAPANLRLLEGGLEDTFDCRCAAGGAEALEVLGSWIPDLVLLDVVMPGLNGLAVCRRLKEDPALRDIPVIFVTGRDDEADELEGLESGAVDYITKPFSLPIVKARVGTHLELKRCHDLLRDHAFVDGLTGIGNRRRFEEALAQAWAMAVRQRAPLGLVLLDVDHFKAYNDTYGHPAGDSCLLAVGKALKGALPRVSDLVARYGGEEFVVLLPGTDLEGTQAVAETLRGTVAAMKLPHARSSAADHVTVSLGAASCLPHLKLVSAALVEAADEALYRAKQAGRNRVGV